MGKRTFLFLVNVCIIASLAVFFVLGHINEQELLIVAPVSLLVLNIVTLLGLRARKRSD